MGTPRGVWRFVLLAEIVIFFGPGAAVALMGLLTLVPAMVLLVQKALGTIDPVNDVPWLYALQPVLLSVGAWAGLFALQEVVRTLLAGRSRLAYPPKILMLLAFAGVAAIVTVGFQVVPHQPTDELAVLCVYAPLLATAHVFIISRRLFFSPPSST